MRALLGERRGGVEDLEAVATDADNVRLVYLARLFLGRLDEERGAIREAAAEYRAAAEVPGGRTARLLEAMRNRYVLRFEPTSTRPGKHRLEVKLHRKGDVRARPSYFVVP